MSNDPQKVHISLRAFESRMKRHCLTKDQEHLKKCRTDSRGFQQLGTYYMVSDHSGNICNYGISFETLVESAREEGVLKAYEEVEDYESLKKEMTGQRERAMGSPRAENTAALSIPLPALKLP